MKNSSKHIHTVYISEIYWNTRSPSDKIHWSKRVLASTYREALTKVLPEIIKQISTTPSSMKRFSVYVGQTHNPSRFSGRLSPFSITRDGKIL